MYGRKIGEKLAIAHFLPTFISKVARLKPLRPKGLRVFWPLAHFLIKCEKNIKNYNISGRKKWPNWPARAK